MSVMMKLVEFENWCHKCVNYTKREDEEPCDECLDNPVNAESHKPVCFVERKDKKK